MEDQLKEIQSKLDEIKKNQSAPWLMPVLLIAVTAIATYINFQAERHYNNADLYPNKLREKIAESRATAIVDFYLKVAETASIIDESFEAYCIFDSFDEKDTITSSVAEINRILNKQLLLDEALKKSVKSYTSYVIENGLMQHRDSLPLRYEESKKRYLKVRSQIDKSLLLLTK